MCFSLQASLIAAGTLTTLGASCFYQHHTNKTKFIALIPVFFGLQQAAEAFIWSQQLFLWSAQTILYASYIFLFFAYILWPLWVPFSIGYAEQKSFIKKMMSLPLIAGIMTAMLLAYVLITGTVQTESLCSHILYQTDIPTPWYIPLSILYLISTITPWFISSITKLWIIGSILLIAYGISLWFYTAAFISVWCFFAAIISSLIMLILSRYQSV